MLGEISQVIVEADAADSVTARRLTAWAQAHGVPVTVQAESKGGHVAPDVGIGSSKCALRIKRQAGAVLKPCTGRTDSLLCCNLQVLTQTVGCPLDCSYCILQDYQNRAEIIVQADPDQVLHRLEQQLAEQPHRLWRVCTGQVADSLALEPEVGFAETAVRRAAGFSNAVLELKTKTDRVDFLLGLPHQGRTIVSWSLNPAAVTAQEEHRAASLERRLAAAAEVARAGYLVAFHLDPMIDGPRALELYPALARRALTAVSGSQVAYVSMGTVRFLPAMRRTVLARFPDSKVTCGELLPDVDGKLRMLAPARVALYRAVAAVVRELCPDAFLYMCMEPPRIWRRALGSDFAQRQEVDLAMAQSLHQRFGLAPCVPRAEDYLP